MSKFKVQIDQHVIISLHFITLWTCVRGQNDAPYLIMAKEHYFIWDYILLYKQIKVSYNKDPSNQLNIKTLLIEIHQIS